MREANKGRRAKEREKEGTSHSLNRWYIEEMKREFFSVSPCRRPAVDESALRT